VQVVDYERELLAMKSEKRIIVKNGQYKIMKYQKKKKGWNGKELHAIDMMRRHYKTPHSLKLLIKA
jgi:hypothetical protein